MNKKIEKYKGKLNKIINTIILLGICIFLLSILISIIKYNMNKSRPIHEEQKISNNSLNYNIDLEDRKVIYKDRFDINIEIKNMEEKAEYSALIKVDDKNIINKEKIYIQSKFNVYLESEGMKNIDVKIFKNEEEVACFNKRIYYIKPYIHQFLDQISNKGIGVHYEGENISEDYSKSLEMISALGVYNIRTDIYYKNIAKDLSKYDYTYYDKWINAATERKINILGIFNGFTTKIFSWKILKEEQQDEFRKFIINTIRRYPQINNYEILNEPNYVYINEDEVKKYSNLIEISRDVLKNIRTDKNLISGVVANCYTSSNYRIKAFDFFKYLTANKGYIYSDAYSYHPYDTDNTFIQNNSLKMNLKKYKETFNSYGGFIKNYVTEYGFYMDNNTRTEEIQAKKLVQQTVLMDKYSIDMSIIYNFWNIGTDINNAEYNYGIVNNNYTPKLSYYAMKNYYQNTNGAEYIGTLNFPSGLESHLYNKDGKPLIIAWSDNTNNTYDFTLNNMTAKDIYGKDIQPDENGNIQITTSPVYLYNVGTNYFYQAIYNVSTTKYDEFLEKFKEEISQVSGLKTSVKNLKGQIQNISNNSSLNEQTAINLMKEHYNLGNTIIQAYKSKTLQVEYVKLSSMLDMLDDIGDSFEDLVTVSSKTRNSNLQETKKLITETENLINSNEELEIIYPTKILQFSKDFYDKAEYINGLEEENDIKTGLIVSKNLHSNLLANWANEFANIYIDKYIEDNPVDIEYSTTALTNQDVTSTLKTTAELTVDNNQNNKQYTFKDNGEFTFEYTIKGRKFTKKATVTNIDKTPPVVTGIENDGFYTGNVTPKVVDSNLQDVKLFKNNNQITNYTANSSISDDGAYRLEAVDKAGNKTIVSFDICKVPATITYSETNLTNKDVIATIVSNYDMQVTNNSNKKQYTFTKNGTFTFEYKIRNKEFKAVATVNYIDKEAPSIAGIEDNKLYIDEAVTPIVKDANLKDVKLYLNSLEVKNYKVGDKVTEQGFYRIVATDLAGNESSKNFNLMQNNSKDYKIKDNVIVNVSGYTNKQEFAKKLNNSLKYQILRNGQALGENDYVATGDTLKLENGKEFDISVTGDLNGDGKVNITDVIRLRKYILTRSNLNKIQLLAADTNLDEKSISVADLIKLRLIVLSRGAN